MLHLSDPALNTLFNLSSLRLKSSQNSLLADTNLLLFKLNIDCIHPTSLSSPIKLISTASSMTILSLCSIE
uniref:Uncharacterized protein n=1 Tax=Octopus bimaculoides TaxID=37653 RepID=A0A0L8GYY9_OCTBM